jgi:hypothetical protein
LESLDQLLEDSPIIALGMLRSALPVTSRSITSIFVDGLPSQLAVRRAEAKSSCGSGGRSLTKG